MATIIIKRTSEYANFLVSCQILIDGNKTGNLSNGQTKEFKTTSGQHTVQAKIDWGSSQKLLLTLSEDDNKELILGGFKYSKQIVYLGLIITVITDILIFALHLNLLFGILLLSPVFLILVYYCTIGRKKYLTLKEL